MRCVAGGTSLGDQGCVFECKWAGLVFVTPTAGLLLRTGRSQLAIKKSTVLIVAIRATDKLFFHAMMERLTEL
jgi:hypothetical protein